MKNRIHSMAGLALLLGLSATNLPGQGALDPPGPPAPSMKSLEQIEPRIDVLTLPGDDTYMHIISQPGSYFLSGNLSVTTLSGILIESNGVTLDLNGFAISDTFEQAVSGSAIFVDASISLSNRGTVTIENGSIIGDVNSNFRFFWGVQVDSARAVRLSKLVVQGCELKGIAVSGIATIENCNVMECAQDAIDAPGATAHSSYGQSLGGYPGINAAQVINSRGVSESGTGILASISVTNSNGETLSDGEFGHGISCEFGIVSNSRGWTVGGNGILARSVTNSFGTSTTGNGIEAVLVSHSYGFSSSGDGILCSGSIDHSFGKSGSGDGIDCAGTTSFSRGETNGGGVGLRTWIAIGNTYTGGKVTGHEYQMP